MIGFSRLPFAALQVQAVRFTNLRNFFSQLSDTLFDGLLHENRLAQHSGAAEPVSFPARKSSHRLKVTSTGNASVHRLPAGCILSLMPSTATFHESRRSTRVPLKLVITVGGGAESRTCEGETIVVNLHGGLIATTIGLSSGMRISIHVYLTNKRAAARVVYIDPKNPLHCGIELDEPRNIWGVSVPPNDWEWEGN